MNEQDYITELKTKLEVAREALICIAVDSTGWINRTAEDALAAIGEGGEL